MVFNFFKSNLEKIKKALAKTSSLLGSKLKILFSKPLDEDSLEELERILYEADLGVQMSLDLTEKVNQFYRQHPDSKPQDLLDEIKRDLLEVLKTDSKETVSTETKPKVILVVGVNGNGKTTSVAKLGKLYKQEGKKVILAAADTFRAAAATQLERWATDLDIDIVKSSAKSDPAAVAFDAAQAAVARGADVLIIDTAGRLHTKTHLMQELEKIKRSCQKVIPTAPHEILLVLDATTGQNAIDQATTFHKTTPITGLVLTKLDGSAKGGIVVALKQKLGIPIQFIGFGETVDDFEKFNAERFVEALFQS